MRFLMPVLALAALVIFLIPLGVYVPSPDLLSVIVLTVALAAWDFVASIRRGDDGR